MSKPICRSFPLLGALGLCLTVGACQDDPPPSKLFDETGVWSVIRYDIEGTGNVKDVNENNRRDAFMLRFEPDKSVVTTAACIEPGSAITPADSPCLISASTTEWECHCFGYDFVEDQMLWREFNAGEPPPTVSVDDAGMPMGDAGGGSGGGTAGGGSGGGGATGDDTLITVAAIENINSTYNFRPLPLDIFGSNGDNSRYIVQARANSKFDLAFDDPDGRPTCTPCVP